MGERAYITPKVLQWARTTARMTEEAAAAKAGVPVENLKEWEGGISQPTIRQAQLLAKTFKRPFALFFLPDIPKDFQPLQDFRRKDAKALGTGSVFIIREIQQKQAWISAINRENGEPKAPFVGRFTIQQDPSVVARNILKTLSIDPIAYENDNPIKEWMNKAEACGIFISRTSFIHSRLKLDSDELQGFAIADPYAPFIFINSDDWNAPQLFTLVHELAHIWIAATGISSDIEPKVKDRDKLHPVELFCNEVAANALIPADIISQMPSSAFESSKAVFAAARKLGVSSFAFLVRALNLQLITLNQYKQLKQAADIEFREFMAKEELRKARRQARENAGGPSYYLLQLYKNSRLFTQTVLDAFRGGFIEPTQASHLLNVPVNKFDKIEAQLYR